MSNIIPPLLSSSPPPMLATLDDEEDEFGDFTVAADISYGCDVSSLPCLTQNTSVKHIDQSISSQHDADKNLASISKTSEKDFQDKRKNTSDDPNSERIITSSGESNTHQQIHTESSINNSIDNSKIRAQVDNRYNMFQYFPEVPPDLVPESINDDEEFGDIDNVVLEEFDEFQSVQDSVSDRAEQNNGAVNNEINISVQSSKGNFELNTQTDFPIFQDDELEERNDKLIEGNKSETLDESNIEIERSYISEEIANVDDTKIESEKKNSVESITINKEEINQALLDDSCGDFGEFRDNQPKPEDVQKLEQDKAEEMSEANLSREVSIMNDGCDDFGEFENHQSELNKCSVGMIQSAKQNIKADLEEDETNDDSGNLNIPCESEGLWISDPFENVDEASFDMQIFEKSVQLINRMESEPEEKDFDNNDGGDCNDDDDFGDFNDYSLQTHAPEDKMSVIEKMCSMNSEVVVQQAESMILEMFTTVEQSVNEYCDQDFTSGDKIFGQLKDVTDTCALSYQWSKSQGQSCLLKALNIDTRNILYGPRWNESMPRYAATLGFTPLEPVKSETLAQTSTESPAISASSHIPFNESVQQSDIPSAQFDWVSSGLTNPLESKY
ncbi:hypothetical protein ILUMI_09043 [Ignelater luminosus]|uniref:Aftiphilin clathrin-binding box domain-containing protein n=1 Tax=Ignelater luminosus TaxID=2038154 RepID=A0A8K0D504_IGNLU|nr:hypothetical protein ILUMI_09043 [Ignelater luminosus]